MSDRLKQGAARSQIPITSAQSAQGTSRGNSMSNDRPTARARIFPPTPYQLPAAMTEWLGREGGPPLPGAKSPSIPLSPSAQYDCLNS